MLGILVIALSIAYLFFYAIRGWWRVAHGPFLIELADLCRGWKIRIRWWQVPLLFAGLVIAPLFESGLGRALIRASVAWLTGTPHAGQ